MCISATLYSPHTGSFVLTVEAARSRNLELLEPCEPLAVPRQNGVMAE